MKLPKQGKDIVQKTSLFSVLNIVSSQASTKDKKFNPTQLDWGARELKKPRK